MNKIKGIGVSAGYAVGTAVVVKEASYDVASATFTTAEEEKQNLDRAVLVYTEDTNKLIEKLTKEAGTKNAEILQGHLVMLSDPFMLQQMQDQIDCGKPAVQAVDAVCQTFYDMFSSVDDEMMKQRASDIQDIRLSLIEIISGVESTKIEEVPSGTILIAKDFTPSMTSRINKENVVGIIAEVGSVTSHSAILARAIDMPAVLSLPDATEIIKDGDTLGIDGGKGYVYQEPDAETIKLLNNDRQAYLNEKSSLLDFFGKETVTKSGDKRLVYGNIGKPEDVQNVIQNSGEGVGLFRTEFLFMDRPALPSEEEQFEAYSTVAKAMGEKEVIIRTLDIGGDKDVSYLGIPKEDNPFLGFRAIRYCLANPELYKTQLSAIIRAARFGNIKIMIPMVTCVEEVAAVRSLIAECELDLAKRGVQFKENIEVGVMIETPAAVFIADELARCADFFSIGTNDLTGYVMAADRGNANVSNLYDVNKPAVLKAIKTTIETAKRHGISVGMCGEAASDRNLIPTLVEWGLDEFSVTPNAILATRKTISEC